MNSKRSQRSVLSDSRPSLKSSSRTSKFFYGKKSNTKTVLHFSPQTVFLLKISSPCLAFSPKSGRKPFHPTEDRPNRRAKPPEAFVRAEGHLALGADLHHQGPCGWDRWRRSAPWQRDPLGAVERKRLWKTEEEGGKGGESWDVERRMQGNVNWSLNLLYLKISELCLFYKQRKAEVREDFLLLRVNLIALAACELQDTPPFQEPCLFQSLCRPSLSSWRFLRT